MGGQIRLQKFSTRSDDGKLFFSNRNQVER